LVGSIASPLGPSSGLCFTNQTYSSSNVRKIAYVICRTSAAEAPKLKLIDDSTKV
jgi:hypothetical protein